MSKQFKKGQIVACWDRDDCDKFICIFVAKEGKFYKCTRAEPVCHDEECEEWWDHCVPLEEIRPDAFLAREKAMEVNNA